MKRCCLAATARVLHAFLRLCALSPLAVSQDLTIQSSHTGTFLLGQTNAYDLLRVSNVGSSPSSGSVTVTGNPPAFLTVTSMHGDGWTCTANSCNRNDALPSGATYPAIMVVATVAHGAGLSLTNQATIAGGGDTNLANNSARDDTALAANGYPLAWGWDYYRQADIPPGLANIVAIAAGDGHSVALRADGTVVAWGDNRFGQAGVPEDLSGVVAIAAGQYHTMALKSDGTVVAWGYNAQGETDVPPGLSNVVAISAGQSFGLALKGDGTVASWGDNTYGQTAVPASLSNVIAISAGWFHGLALRSDGTVVTWGYSLQGWTTVPAGLTDVVAISAGGYDSQALKKDGSLVIWGYDSLGSTDVPAGLSNVVAISTGATHSLALKSDGTLVAWGSTYSYSGEQAVPEALSGVIAFTAGSQISFAILSAAPRTIPIKMAAADMLPVTVDGVWSHNFPFVQDWIPGSSHTLGAKSSEASGPGSQLIFTNWSDGGAMTHTVAPTTATTYTANLKRQYRLTTLTSTGGTINPLAGWVDAGASVQITATPNPGYIFTGFSGGLTGTANPQTLQVTAAVTVTANFAPGTTGGSCTYSSGPSDQSFPVAGGAGAITVTTQDGCTWTIKNPLSWVIFAGSAVRLGLPDRGLQGRCQSWRHPIGYIHRGRADLNGRAGRKHVVYYDGAIPALCFRWWLESRLIVLNTSPFPATVRLNFFADSGTPLALPLNLPQTPGGKAMLGSTLERTMAVGATLVIDTASAGPLSQTGWVQVLSTGEVAGYDNFRLATGTGYREVFLPMQSANASALVLPFDHTAEYGTGIAVANSSMTSGSVRITLRDDLGNLILSTTTQVPMQGHTSFDLAGQYPVTAGLRGTIELEGAGAAGIGALSGYSANGEIAAVVPVVK